MLYAIIGFLVAIGILVVVHEYGHYLVAKLFNVKVLRFSIGFGPIISRFKTGKDQTEWAISAIPLGGYVKMLEKEQSSPEETHRAFDSLSPLKRMAIAASGPLANFLFAILVCWILGIIGTREVLPRIGAPTNDTPAQLAGLRTDDLIREVDGRPIYTFQDLTFSMIDAILGQRKVDVLAQQPNSDPRHLTVNFESFNPTVDASQLMEQAGFVLMTPTITPLIGQVAPNSPAIKAGLHPNDLIVRLDDEAVTQWQEVVTYIQQRPGMEIQMEVSRDDRMVSLILTPDIKQDGDQSVGFMGASVSYEPILTQLSGIIQLSPVEAFRYALRQVNDNIKISLRFFGTMITGKMSSTNLSGPIAIADFAGQSAQHGIDSFFKFLALISVGLGIINLLPIPLLDGGHLLYYAIEFVRGKPLSSRQQAIGQAIGLAIVVSLTLLVFYNDINRYFVGSVE